MNRRIGLALGVLAITSIDCFAQKVQSDSNRAAERIAQTRIVEAVKARWTNDTGFSMAPITLHQEVSENDTNEIKEVENKYPTAWKAVDEKFADAYAKRQEPLNNKQLKDAATFRKLINEAILAACKLRGGGSASAQLFKFSKAETEWILRQLQHGTAPEMNELEFAKQLRSNIFYVDGEPTDGEHGRQFSRCLELFSKAERLLTPAQRSVLRAEVINYFTD